MKFILTSITGLCLLATGFPQVYHPIPTDSVYWVETEQGLDGGNCQYNTYRCIYPVGNVTINSYLYTEYRWSGFTSYIDIMWPWTDCPGTQNISDFFYAYIRNDSINKKVYLYDSLQSHQDILLYDFSKTVGDTLYPVNANYGGLNICTGDTFVVMIEDSIDIGGEYRRRLVLNKPAFTGDSISMIEGIGSNLGFAFNIYCPFEQISGLVCFNYKTFSYSPPSQAGSPYCSRTLNIESEVLNDHGFIQLVSTNNYYINNPENNSIQISCYDVLGKFMLEKTLQESGYLDFTEIPSGIYFMDIIYNGQSIKPYKFIVGH